MSTPDSIVAHHEKWDDLPLFPQGQWVATDEDIAAWNDIVYMRTLVESLLSELDTPADTHDALGGFERDGRGLIESDIDIHIEPWTDADRAGDMLAAWRSGTSKVDVFAAAVTA